MGGVDGKVLMGLMEFYRGLSEEIGRSGFGETGGSAAFELGLGCIVGMMMGRAT